MEAQLKQKLCWNCEARVDFGIESCPSCGVYLSTSPLLEQSAPTISNYSTPPYRHVAYEQDTQIPESPYNFQESIQENVVTPDKKEVKQEEAAASTIFWKKELMPMGLLFAGSIFSLFGIVLLLFSNNGELVLRWNGEYWYVYLLLGVPFLTFGWKSLEKVYSTTN